jgi:hypothetical protein
MLTARVADLPMIVSVRRSVAEEWLAEPFRVSGLFGRNRFPEIVGTSCSSQRFS